MNFGLLWMDALAALLVWVAAAAAFAGRFKRKWIRVVVLAFLLGPGPLLVVAVDLKFDRGFEPSSSGYAISLVVAFLLGASFILRQASRRFGGIPAAASWKRVPLALTWLMFVAIGYVILCNMDLVIRARCAITSVRVQAEYLAALPAVVSESQNAAPLYEEAFARLDGAKEEEEAINNPPTGINDTFDPKEPATISFLAHQAGTIALLRRAAALPACRFEGDLTGPSFEAIFPDLSKERNAAQVLRLNALEEIARGHAASAIDDADAIMEMGRHFGERPLLVSALVGVGIDAIGDYTLQQALPAVKSRDDLNGLHLDQIVPVGRTVQESLRGEEVFGLLQFATMTADASVAGERARSNRSLMASGTGPGGAFFRVFYLDLDDYLTFFQNLQDAVLQPYYKIQYQFSGSNSPRGLFTSLLAPSMSRFLNTCAKCEANDEAAKIGVAATRYRLDHGALPDKLEKLVPDYLDEIPIDPFDGKPMKLKIAGGRWTVYSVGIDGRDVEFQLPAK